MVQITPFGTTTPKMIQTWKITAHGDITNVRNAESEVSAILETQITPAFAYAAFATNNGCAALDFTGNGTTNSYNSGTDRKSTRLNSSHQIVSYAVFCLK